MIKKGKRWDSATVPQL